jgi:hypothetical protein
MAGSTTSSSWTVSRRVIEAKPEGTTLVEVEHQSGKYVDGLPGWMNPPVYPLPFIYESTGSGWSLTTFAEVTERLLPLPSVATNLRDLTSVLTDSAAGPFAREHVSTVLDPSEPRAVAGPVLRAAEEAEDVFLVYFAGHGVTGGIGSRLYLTLPASTSTDAAWTSVPYQLIRDVMLQTRATTRIVIL